MSSTPGWESVKENAAPLQRGRNVSALERAAATSRGFGGVLQAEKDDSAERVEEFERLVRPSEAPHATEAEGDPLVHWMAYIKYCQEHLPSDTHQQFLLMERCTRALVKMPNYANDDRFISVCAKYADKTKEPGQVFKYLHQQKVGQTTALFWVAWAFVAEKDGDFSFAEQIYKKGISKDAQPMNMLKVRHKQFQRRMSRHWLNSSQRNEELDEYEDGDQSSSRLSRGALGSLAHDRIHRYDRARRAPQHSQGSRPSGRRPTASNGRGIRNNTNKASSNGSFAIFVEGSGENALNSYLDQAHVENKRVIEREADRRKENTLDAERWNERGGLAASTATQSSSSSAGGGGGFLSRSSHSRTGSRGAPTPFAVFVDEECVAQHEREESEKQSQAERHRSVRDERTFRERSDEGTAERLKRDPLRYVRDPTQLESDATSAKKSEAAQRQTTGTEPGKATTKRSAIGFNKKLLKNEQGREQSFEEHRAASKGYFIAPSGVNFNLLHVVKGDQSSQMDLDEGESQDLSMEGSSKSATSAVEEQPRKLSRIESRSEARVLFRQEPSFESLNQTAISNASSVINESDAVGVPTRKEEETINTKLAMRELSMMFSSPAFGVDDIAKRTERKMMDSSIMESNPCPNSSSFANLADGLEHSMLDNSILNFDSENQGPTNPSARPAVAVGFDSNALREVSSETDTDIVPLDCSSQQGRARIQTAQASINRRTQATTTLDEDAGFQIFEDPAPSNADGFSIFQDHEEVESPKKTEIEVDEDIKPAASTFAIHDGQKNLDDNSNAGSEPDPYAQGDTATFSILGDVDAVNENPQIFEQHQTRASSIGVSEQGDTATLSIFNEVFQDLSETRGEPPAAASAKDTFSIFVDAAGKNESTASRRGNIRESSGGESTDSIDYESIHERSIKMALRRLQTSSSVASNSRSPLLSLLSLRGQSFHLPHISLPREFRAKHISGNTRIQIGKHSGVMCRELGRGACGVVVLMDLQDGTSEYWADTIAVKAQAPTDSLAWECEILRRLHHRTADSASVLSFPSPLSFISLADGGILSMSAGSKTGLNLVDLANIYKLRLGEHVPEIVVLHYVSRMIRHLEQLHWHGKILHCDVKPDNFVLCSLMDCEDNSQRHVPFSDLMLVDFGRAIDLEEHATDTIDARSVMFHGNACLDDMQCVSMRAGRPWSYDIDTFGVLACAHVLLWGTHIQVRKGKKGRWYLYNTLKRYWQRDLWTKIFDTLLNLDEESGAAIGSRARSLRSLRAEIDAHTEDESEKLASFLTRQLSLLPSSRDQLV